MKRRARSPSPRHPSREDRPRNADVELQHRLLSADELFRGTLAQMPSVGVAEPSRADELLTQSLKQALALVDIRTLDHFVVAGHRVVSFAERGLL